MHYYRIDLSDISISSVDTIDLSNGHHTNIENNVNNDVEEQQCPDGVEKQQCPDDLETVDKIEQQENDVTINPAMLNLAQPVCVDRKQFLALSKLPSVYLVIHSRRE